MQLNNKTKTNFVEFGVKKKTIFGLYSKFGLNTKNNPQKVKGVVFNKINNCLKKLLSGKKLEVSTTKNIDFSIAIKSYRGIRHKLKYPARGQRTHTNAKTKKKFTYKKI